MTRVLLTLTLLAGLFMPGPSAAFTMIPVPRAPSGLPLVLIQSTGCDVSPCDEPTPTPTPTPTEKPVTDKNDKDPAPLAVPKGVPADAVGITPAATKAIVDAVNEANRYCRDHYDPIYVIDCIARAYVRIGRTLPYRGGYGTARTALMEAGTRLHELAIANTDKTAEPKMGATSRRSAPEFLRPVKRTPKVNAEAAAIIEGSQLVLLRSASGSDQRRVAYEQVANVVGSTVVLLRSGRRKKRRNPDGAHKSGMSGLLSTFAPRRGAPPPAGPSPA